MINSTAFLSKLIETANMMIVGINNAGNTIIFNAEAEKISGYSREEVIGKNWLEKILPKEMFADLWKNVNDLIINYEIPASYENPLITKSGETKIILWHSVTLMDDNSQTAHISFGIDISEKRKAEENLKLKSTMLDTIADSIFLTDENGNIEYFNRGGGLAPENAAGKNIRDLFDETGGKLINENLELLKNTAEATFEIIYHGKFEMPLILEMRISKIYYGGKKYILFISRNITERKKNQIKLQDLNATKDRLFSIIGHDLKGPVGSASKFFDMIADNQNDMPKDQLSEFLKYHSNSLKNIKLLLDNLLEWARSQKNETAVKIERVNIKSTVSECVELLKGSADSKNIELSFDINDDLNARADSIMIKTVIRNLISNAVKYCREKGKIKAAAKIKGETILISIADNGIGMDEETLCKLFKISEKVSRKGTGGESGTGFGLILCAEFIAKNGGKIWAESKNGYGSTFYIELPAY